MRKREKHGPHMTGLSADAAASCGDDTLSQKRTSLKGGNTRRLRKPPEGRFVNDSSCAADSDISARVVHNTPKRVGMLLALTDNHRTRR